MINTERIRQDFPLLQRPLPNGKLPVYFDNAATTQRPLPVLQATENYILTRNGNPHRGAHYLATAASQAYDGARERIARSIGAQPEEVIFTRNATESLNLVAACYGAEQVRAGDNIVITVAEHHANLVPWQRVARRNGAELRYMYLTEDGHFRQEDFAKIDARTKIVGFAQVSNVLGMYVPVAELTRRAHAVGAKVVLDGAQSAPHMAINVRELDCDFFAFSGHKMLAAQGIGVLYGRRELLEAMPPFLLGGDMIEYVREQDTTFNEVPHKFEAGTPNAEGAVSLAAAFDYLETVGWDEIAAHEAVLTEMALAGLQRLPYVRLLGSTDPREKYGVIAFLVEGVHPHDVATILDSYGIAVRSGHHCAQPLGAFYDAPASTRLSFYLYNTEEEVEYFLKTLPNVRKLMGLA